ncbi:MAG: SpoIID/LytB domain-containing protein [Candidatus Eremiobacteraeota bacterium]|nr:SpoIID/LytB domain-containing protein [Candidatus Eremiobacteraeota bacterium]
MINPSRFRFPSGIITYSVLIVLLVFLNSGCATRKDKAKPPSSSPVIQGKKSPSPRIYDVLIVKSPGSLKFFGWKGESDLKGAESALYRLGVDYAYVEESELAKDNIPCKILLLANTRCMSADAIEGIKKFSKEGGKVFATYMSGYRDEDNRLPGKKNNFLLSDVYGVDFYQWAKSPSRCEYILPSKAKKPIQLGRNQSMLIRPHEDTQILARWLTADKKPERADSAITYNEKTGTIYCGEDIFARENSESPEVLAYIGQLIEKLEPGVVKKKIDPHKKIIKPDFSIPQKIVNAVKPAGDKILIGLNTRISSIYLSCESESIITADSGLYAVKRTDEGETYEKKANVIGIKPGGKIYLMAISVQGKLPYINVYDSKKKLLARCYSKMSYSGVGEKSPVKLIDLNPNGTYDFQSYRGEVQFIPEKSGRIRVMNLLTLDEYVAGVVPREVPASYPKEALRAMAVVARTFAESSRGKHKKEGFDVCNTVHCQVYGGLMGERLSASEAVADTSGEIVASGGSPVFTTFHSTCGGYGADVSSVWSGKSRHLVGGFDGPGKYDRDLSDEKTFREFIDNPPNCYCNKSGRFRWVETYSRGEMKKLLDESLGYFKGRGKMDVGRIYSMKIIDRAKDGRMQVMEIVTSQGTYHIKKDRMRWITSGGKIGTGGLPSTLFYLTPWETGNEKREKGKGKSESGFKFTGGGWGHGVGMCQEGARGMAEAGKDYREIIRHYYEDVEIER